MSLNGVGRRSGGFTLLEVLVAAVILALGLLGMASVHTISQRHNHSAYLRSQAVLQIYDISDRMRANPVALQAGAFDAVTPPAGTPPAVNCKTAPDGCTPAELATFDIWTWNTANALLLPSGQGVVNANPAAGTYTVTVRWDDDRQGSLEEFSAEFQP